jgi:hypothetical protein
MLNGSDTDNTSISTSDYFSESYATRRLHIRAIFIVLRWYTSTAHVQAILSVIAAPCWLLGPAERFLTHSMVITHLSQDNPLTSGQILSYMSRAATTAASPFGELPKSGAETQDFEAKDRSRRALRDFARTLPHSVSCLVVMCGSRHRLGEGPIRCRVEQF